jgi:hypothetical protein
MIDPPSIICQGNKESVFFTEPVPQRLHLKKNHFGGSVSSRAKRAEDDHPQRDGFDYRSGFRFAAR